MSVGLSIVITVITCGGGGITYYLPWCYDTDTPSLISVHASTKLDQIDTNLNLMNYFKQPYCVVVSGTINQWLNHGGFLHVVISSKLSS